MLLVRLLMLTAAACLASAACGDDVPRDRVLGDEWAPADRDAGDVDRGDANVSDDGVEVCRPAVASEPLPAREVTMSSSGPTENAGVFTTELYGQFVDYCGSCHTQGRNQGSFDVSRATFVEKITDEVIARARSNDADEVMPPTSLPFAMRDPQSPLVKFVELLTEWYEAGKPADVFYPSAVTGGGAGTTPYRLSPAIGFGLTNIGHCVPSKSLVSTKERQDDARALDARFAAMRTFADLPKSLRDTDIPTFDTAELARRGVIAFAPTYTLWADNAKKIRFIRVPVGESVHFNAAQQSFDIPENTRFYKTFFKPVIDREGRVRYRKMETRLILSRPDRVNADGTLQHTALFATYKWDDNETEATLHETPYRDGSGFTDDLRVYVTDERLEDQVVRAAPTNLDQALLEAGARRTYPMPGADRCVNCHMGSKNFVLGFTPMQVRRRPLGEGGVIEPAVGHELNQLQRLIDYGVITGMDSPDQVVGLEDSQPGRAPRNEHELNAQGYMLGNCAHCHNPNGFPSRREPILRDVLDFMPSAHGGIFQFPLDTFSPRTFRGESQDIRIPYITPSLFDHPAAVASNDANTGAINLSNKWITVANPTAAEQAANALILELPLRTPAPTFEAGDLGAMEREDPSIIPRKFTAGFEMMELQPGRPLLAPWRSLIYRNVDAPFSYEDGGTIFPRMPMDTPGYDCRVRRLISSWMTSIPARRKPPMVELPDRTRLISYPGLEQYEELIELEDQPYVEVFPGDADYDEQVRQAQTRLEVLRRSERYNDCPSPELDGVAPEVISGRSVLPYTQRTEIRDAEGNVREFYDLLSSARPHYPKTDLRNDPNWVIRRPDWSTVLVTDQVDPAKEAAAPIVALSSRQTIAAVRELQITPEVEAFLLDEQPMGLWQDKAECHDTLGSAPRVADFAGESQPSWMQLSNAPATAPVYMQSAGAQVFDMICSRCHGPDATGTSALATTIADLTGGLTRVANLRDGLFGPPEMPGSGWAMEFGDATNSDAEARNAEARNWAARYMAWMGLGGTVAQIPATVLTRLRSGEVMGERPQGGRFKPNAADAANMLTVAKLACEVFLPSLDMVLDPVTGRFVRESAETTEVRTLQKRGLITRNGVAELWERLCHLNNVGPLRQVEAQVSSAGGLRLVVDARYYSVPSDTQRQTYNNIFSRNHYPADAWVGDSNGAIVRGLQPNNQAPWCIAPLRETDSAFDTKREALEQLAEQLDRSFDTLPWCPAEAATGAHAWSVADGSRWAIRGAANAGLAVFLYLDALSHGRVQRKPSYDRCEEL